MASKSVDITSPSAPLAVILDATVHKAMRRELELIRIQIGSLERHLGTQMQQGDADFDALEGFHDMAFQLRSRVNDYQAQFLQLRPAPVASLALLFSPTPHPLERD